MNASCTRSVRIGGLIALLLGSSAFSAFADEVEIRITNLTRGQVFSPVIAWSHNRSFTPFFAFGQPASEDVRAIAEDGNTGPLAATLAGDGTVLNIVTDTGPIPPGGTSTLTVDIQGGQDLISLGSMLVNTNDTFFALRGLKSPRNGQSTAVFQPGWDAGTEDNNEDCAYIPGPACAAEEGNIADPDDGEGYVFTQEGIHGVSGGVATSDLDPSQHDWRNPVAYIVVTRVK